MVSNYCWKNYCEGMYNEFMAFAKSAKDILISNDFLEARQKAARYVHHEFQDYGYRLATDLGDVAHTGIYMKLAKTVDRTLLEQAAAFALGYFDEPNKGKIFMWRVQYLRRLAQQKQDMRNTEHGFVMQKMGKIIDELADVYAAVQRRDYNADREKWLAELAAKLIEGHPTVTDPGKLRVLIVGCGVGLEVAFFNRMGLNTFGVDVSRKLLAKGKAKIDKPQRLVRKLNMLESKYKDNYFHMVVVCKRFWELVPLNVEQQYLEELSRISKEDGLIVLEANKAVEAELAEPKDGWEKFTWQEQEYIKFKKINIPSCLPRLTELAKSMNLEIA